MKSFFFRVAFIFFITTFAIQGYAVGALIDSSTINFSASGSPNTIGGSWSADSLSIPSGATIEYFKVTMIGWESDFGMPSSIQLNNYRGAICFGGGNCIAGVAEGSTDIVRDFDWSTHLAWDLLMALVEGNIVHLTSGTSQVGFSSGGISASITGQILVEAYGQVAPVPIPPTVWLLGSGLIGLVGLRRRFKK